MLDVVVGAVRTARPSSRCCGAAQPAGFPSPPPPTLAPAARLGVYPASKYAVVGVAETLRLELAADGIGVYPSGTSFATWRAQRRGAPGVRRVRCGFADGTSLSLLLRHRRGREVRPLRAHEHRSPRTGLAWATASAARLPRRTGTIAPKSLRFRDKVLPDGQTLVMAIVNRTPDSFFDRGRTYGLAAALDRVDQVVDEGAHVVDIGGVKAAPGQELSVAEELERVLELVERVRDRHPGVVISVDTYRSQVADAVCRAGADLVNDAWGAPDPRTAEVAAEHGAGIVCTHAGGLPPRTRPHRAEYEDVVDDVRSTVVALAERAVAVGVPRESVLIDPGHDFGKNSRQSLEVTRRLDALTETGWPVLCALSRKDFVGEVLDLPPDDRLEGTLAATAISAWLGARMFRAHDVAATVRVVRMVDALLHRRDLAVARRGLA